MWKTPIFVYSPGRSRTSWHSDESNNNVFTSYNPILTTRFLGLSCSLSLTHAARIMGASSLMGLCHSPSLTLIKYANQTVHAHPHIRTYIYVDDVNVIRDSYQLYPAIMNHANSTKEMAGVTTCDSLGMCQHLPFDRGPTRTTQLPTEGHCRCNGLYTTRRRHDTCPSSTSRSARLPFDRGPVTFPPSTGKIVRRHDVLQQWNTIPKVSLRRRILPFNRGPEGLPFDRGPERPRLTNGELLHQHMDHVPLSPG